MACSKGGGVGDGAQHSAAADLQERSEQQEKGECEKSGVRVFFFLLDIHPAAGSTFAKLSPTSDHSLAAVPLGSDSSRSLSLAEGEKPPHATPSESSASSVRANAATLHGIKKETKPFNCQEVSGSCRYCSSSYF